MILWYCIFALVNKNLSLSLLRQNKCYAVFDVTDEELFLQDTRRMSMHEAANISVSGTASHLQKRLER